MNYKRELKRICIFADGYPTKEDPQYAFIRPVVCELADQGIKCTVITPQSVTRILLGKVKARRRKWIDSSKNGNNILILQPYTITLSNLISTHKLTEIICRRTYFHNKVNADILYGHFWKNGVLAARIAQDCEIPVVAVCGEAEIEKEIRYTYKDVMKRIGLIKGLICVSSRNLIESKRLGLVSDMMNVTVLPNGFDRKSFYKMDRKTARQELKLDNDSFIGIAVGEYNNRKGIERIIEAAKGIPELKLILIGEGNPLSDKSQVIISGPVPHNRLVYYYNAADFFVLPTLAEGCCNAIIEALACGLPVISSNLPFNDDVLCETNSIRIDPTNIAEIKKAMICIKENNTLRENLSIGALESAKNLTIEVRAKKILDFIRKTIGL